MIIDTHAHYDDSRFEGDREALLLELKEHNIIAVNASADMPGCRDTLSLTERYPHIYGMLGVHPQCVGELTEADMEWIKKEAAGKKIVAIGEIGLDYHDERNPAPKIQQKWFARQIALAKETGLPVNVHSRDAAADTLELIRSEKAEDCGGIIHCFSYGPEMARIYVELGFYIGIGGVVTFSNGKKLKEVVKEIPLERIVLETDSPYLAPDGHRGERNCSLYLDRVLEQIAQIKGINIEETESATEANARRVYRI
ncbi:MAG: TatD family hydrolase [Lachnospiraceae bacterium]|nr:TatD family hydrolase [Lachnospiraceae bacterium]